MTFFAWIRRRFRPSSRTSLWEQWPYNKWIARYSGPAAEKCMQGILISDFVRAWQQGSWHNLEELLNTAFLPPVQSTANEVLNQRNFSAMLGLLRNRDRYTSDEPSLNSGKELESPLWDVNTDVQRLYYDDSWALPEKTNELPIDTFDVTVSWPYQKLEPYLAQTCGLIAKHWCFAPQVGGLGDTDHWQMRLKLRHGLDYRSARAVITAALWFPNLVHDGCGIQDLYERGDMFKEGRLRRLAGVAMRYTHVEPTQGQASKELSQAFYGYVSDPKTLRKGGRMWSDRTEELDTVLLMDKPDWYPWQQEVLDMPNKEREVIVIADKFGNTGKSYLAKWLQIHQLGIMIPATQRAELVEQAVKDMYDYGRLPETVIIDIPRAIKGQGLHALVAVIENIKNGTLVEMRYHYSGEIINPPRVIICCNNVPDPLWLTPDRWKCFTLTPVVRDEQGRRVSGGELQSADIFALWKEQQATSPKSQTSQQTVKKSTTIPKELQKKRSGEPKYPDIYFTEYSYVKWATEHPNWVDQHPQKHAEWMKRYGEQELPAV